MINVYRNVYSYGLLVSESGVLSGVGGLCLIPEIYRKPLSNVGVGMVYRLGRVRRFRIASGQYGMWREGKMMKTANQRMGAKTTTGTAWVPVVRFNLWR